MLQVIRASAPVESITIYSSTGMLVRKVQHTSVLSVNDFSNGVYIIRVADGEGRMLSKKIVIG